MSTDALYAALMAKVDALADVMGYMYDARDVFCNMGCSEIDAIAEVLEQAGHNRVAEFIREEHCGSDEEDDAHYELRLEVEERERQALLAQAELRLQTRRPQHGQAEDPDRLD